MNKRRTSNDTLSLPEYLKNLRKALGYSQQFVSDKLNVTRQTYSHYETGRIVPPAATIYAIARLYGEDVETLIEKTLPEAERSQGNQNDGYSAQIGIDDIAAFSEFINSEEQNGKYRLLSDEEKKLLYYYSSMDHRDREDILSYLRVKRKRYEQR